MQALIVNAIYSTTLIQVLYSATYAVCGKGGIIRELFYVFTGILACVF